MIGWILPAMLSFLFLLILFRPLELFSRPSPIKSSLGHIGGPIFASFSGSICFGVLSCFGGLSDQELGDCKSSHRVS